MADVNAVAVANFNCPLTTCKQPKTKPCKTANGVALKTPHGRRLDMATGWIACAALDAAQIATLTANVASLQGTILDLQAQIKALITPTINPVSVGAPTLGSVVYEAPSNAVQATAGNLAKVISALPSGASTVILRGGTYNESINIPRGKQVTFQPYSASALNKSEQVYWTGSDKLTSLMVAADKVVLKGFDFGHYAPASQNNGSNVGFYLGGLADGSVFQDCTFHDSKMAHLGFQIQNLKVSNCTFLDSQFSAVMGTTCDGLNFSNNLISRYNLGGYPPEPQTAAMKITRSKNILVYGNQVSDGNGSYGLWLDVGCVNFVFVNNHVDGSAVGSRKQLQGGVEFEVSDQGIFAGNTVKGCFSGLKLLSAGMVRIWCNDLRGNTVGLYLQQDNRINQGQDPQAGSVTEDPWKTLNNEICNNLLDGSYPFIAYDDGKVLNLLGGQMFTAFKGNKVSGSAFAELGKSGGMRNKYANINALAAAGTDVGGPLTSKVSADPQVVPTDIANLLGFPSGAKTVGPA